MRRLLSVITLWVLLAGAALAQGCPFPAADGATPIANHDITLARLKLTDCLGDPVNDAAPIVRNFNAQTEKPTLLGQTDRLKKAVELLAEFSRQHEAVNLLAPQWKAMTQELLTVRVALDSLGGFRSGTLWLAQVERTIDPKWRQVSAGRQPMTLGGQPVNLLASAGCTNGQPPCPEFLSQLDLVRVANLMNRLRSYAQSPNLAEQFDDSQLALERWKAYREDGQHQYFWEVFVNGKLMGKDLCPEDAGSGLKMGFCKVPESAWIVLHPEAALRWGKAADRTSQLQPALVVELFGRSEWRWDGAQMTSQRGYSIAATYSQTEAEKRWAFGPMLHSGRMSLALTKAAGGRWSLVVNAPLGDAFFGHKQAVTDELRSVDKSSLLGLLFGP